jgi:hypothetical protein
MAIGVIFAGLIVATGLGVARCLRLPFWTAPTAGLAGLAIASVWLAAVDALQTAGAIAILAVAAAGLSSAALRTRDLLRVRPEPVGPASPSSADSLRSSSGSRARVVHGERATSGHEKRCAATRSSGGAIRGPLRGAFFRAEDFLRPLTRLSQNPRFPWRLTLIAVAACLAPLLLLGIAFAGVEAPLSTHDGAFHVETINALRHGARPNTWYPIGFHALAAAMLGLVPWLDSARGTAEVGLGLAVLAPLSVLSLARTFKLEPAVATASAAIVALTWIYPYDYHLWGGWPQGMGALLVLGVWTAALGWLRDPRLSWAVMIGILGAAILVTHGIDLYSAALGLLVFALVEHKRIHHAKLIQHAPLAALVAALLAAPYLETLLGWASAGGATDAAQLVDTTAVAEPDALLQFANGITGAASALDLPVRTALIVLGIVGMWHSQKAIAATWGAFSLLLVVSNLPLARPMYNLTYPWLADQRPREIAVILASLLAAIGLVITWRRLRTARLEIAAARRLAIGFVLLIGFFAEGTSVSIYKRLVANVATQDTFSADDGAAMAWLRLHATPGTVLINDRTADAGIWAPYKADVPILLPRSAPGEMLERRAPILEHVLDLGRDPVAQQEVCALRVDYVYSGARPLAFEVRHLSDRQALERAPYLKEVFSSGGAAVFQIELPCSNGHG